MIWGLRGGSLPPLEGCLVVSQTHQFFTEDALIHELQVIGDLGHEADAKEYITVRRRIPENLIYKQLYFRGDTVSGGVLIGDIKKSTALSRAMNRILSKEEMLALMD